MKTVQQCLRLLIITLIGWTIKSSLAEIRVVCYYTNWSVYRPGTAKFNPQNINPYLCTHLIYAFGGFTKESNFKPFDKYQDIEKGGYAKFTGLKTYNKNLKTMLAIGGWNEGSSRFSPMVANAEKRKEFVKNSIKFLRQNHFDGLDLDWEYPAFRDGGKARDRDNYASLVQELREEYDRESEKTGRPRLLLTMAVPAGIEYINKGYDVPKLMKYLDWMNILSYDYHSAFEPAVNHHSPLFGLEEESEYNYDSDLNINHTISHYLEAGAISDKLVLGIPTYGRSYTLFNPDATEIGSPADGPGEMGEATRENGYLAYYEICEKLKDDDEWIVEQPNPNAMGPYAYKDNLWVGYDDEAIVRKKSEFVAKNKLGGIMFWSIDNDDFRGTCTGKPYPLIEAAKEALMSASGYIVDNVIPAREKSNKLADSKRKRKRPTSAPKKEEEEEVTEAVSSKRRIKVNKKKEVEEEVAILNRRKTKRRRGTTTTTASSISKYSTPSYTTPEPPTTPDAGTDFKCEDEGFFSHPRDCKKYYWCLSSGPSELGIIAHQFTCPSGLYFNKAADSCDYTQNVLCNKKKATPKTTTTTTTETPSTTAATSPVSISLTTRRPLPKITAATSRTTYVQSSTIEYEEEYEYEDEEEEKEKEKDDIENSEEDPRVIKELLDLIKKAGGIEELEKQLTLYETNSTSVTASDSTTPSSFSKSLYQRVLSRTVNKSKDSSSKTSNSRGPQFQGIGSLENSSKSRRTRPQYTAISRQRQTSDKTEQENPDDTEIEKKDDDAEEETTSKGRFVPEYKTISRSRSTSTTEAAHDSDDSTKTLTPETQEKEEAVEKQVVTSKTPEYITLNRRRSTTSAPPSTDSTSSKYVEIRGRSSTTSEASPSSPETVTEAQLNVTISFRSIPGEEEIVNETATTRKDEKDSVLVKSDTQTVYVASSTEPTKVSDNFSPSKNPSRSRFYTKITRPTPTYTESVSQTTSRSRSRFTIAQQEVEIQKETESSEQGTTERGRRRGSQRFTIQQTNFAQHNDGLHYDDGSYHADLYQERKFRPDIAVEISDLSSLTSADLSIKDFSRGRSHRRRLPENSNEENHNSARKTTVEDVKETKTTTTVAPTQKTTNLPVRIHKPSALFNRRTKISGVVVNETKSTNERRHVNSESATENSIVTPKAAVESTPTRKKLLRRVRPTLRPTTVSTTPSTTTSASVSTTTFTSDSPSTTSSTSTSTSAPTSFSTVTSDSLPTPKSDKLLLINNSTKSSSTSTTLKSTTTTLLTSLESNSIIENGNSSITVEDDNDDDVYKTSEEEEENIKLSESNIREASEISLNSFSDKPRRRIVKKIFEEGKSSQVKFNGLDGSESSTTEATFKRRTIVRKVPTVTEPTPISSTVGRRRIIKKIQPTTEEAPPNSSTVGRRRVLKKIQPVTEETAPVNRTRKIIRRLKVPPSEETPSLEFSEETPTSEESFSTSEETPNLKSFNTSEDTVSLELSKTSEEPVEVQNKTAIIVEEVSEKEMTTLLENIEPTTDAEVLTTTIENNVETTLPPTTATVTTPKSTTSLYFKSKFSRPPFLKTRGRPATEPSPVQVSTKSLKSNNAFSRFNTRRKNILSVKSTTESVQNVTEAIVTLAPTTLKTTALPAITEVTTEAPERTTEIETVQSTVTDAEFLDEPTTVTEADDAIKFVTDASLEEELKEVIRLFEEKIALEAKTKPESQNKTLPDVTEEDLLEVIRLYEEKKALEERNATETLILNLELANNVSLTNSTVENVLILTDNSTQTQNDTEIENSATKTKAKPNLLLRSPQQRPKFVPKARTTTLTTSDIDESVKTIGSSTTVKPREFSVNEDFVKKETLYKINESEIVSNETVFNTTALNNDVSFGNDNLLLNVNETEEELKSVVTNHPLFAHHFKTKLENETENLSNVTVENNKTLNTTENFETDKLNAEKRNSTKVNKFKRILESEALRTSTTRRPFFKPKSTKRPLSRQNSFTQSKEESEESKEEGQGESSTEVNESSVRLEKETIDLTKKLALKRPTFKPKLRLLINRGEGEEEEDEEEEGGDEEEEKQDEAHKFVISSKRPPFSSKFLLPSYNQNTEDENEVATEENQVDFETRTENYRFDENYNGEEGEDHEDREEAPQISFQRPKFVPKNKFSRNKEEGSVSSGRTNKSPPRFGAGRKNFGGKKGNNPEVQHQAIIQSNNARNRLFNKTRKANTPFAGGATSPSTTSTTESPTTIEEIQPLTSEEAVATTQSMTPEEGVLNENIVTPEEGVTNENIVTTEENIILEGITTEEIIDSNTIVYEEGRTTEQKKETEKFEFTTSEKQPETTEQAYTLHHVFAEPASSTLMATTEKETDRTPIEPSNRDAKKLERLIEVNRIVEVSLKEGKLKHNLMVENEVTLGPVLDRIGQINRVTVIKVVDPSGDLKLVLSQNNGSAKIEKAEISESYGKLTRYGEKLEAYLLPAGTSQDLKNLKSKIEIYGKSIVNTYTPITTTKSPFSAEASTIALEGLFKPLMEQEAPKEDNDEILETQNANYVNIRVLKSESDEDGVVIQKPMEVGSRARVVEITPEMNSKIIKIAPIAIAFSNTQTVNQN